jgi:hypothetical protein
MRRREFITLKATVIGWRTARRDLGDDCLQVTGLHDYAHSYF